MKTFLAVLALCVGVTACLRADEASDKARRQVVEETVKVYPDLANKESVMFRLAAQLAFEMSDPAHPDHAKLQAVTGPRFCADKAASLLGKTPTAAKPATVKMVTAEEIKAYWLKNLPAAPSTLSPGHHAAVRKNMEMESSIRTGALDGTAQDEAARINIDALRAAGRHSEADLIQRQRDALAAREHQQALANRVTSEMRAQTDALRGIGRQLNTNNFYLQQQTQAIQNIERR
jgi:hypothetical protein